MKINFLLAVSVLTLSLFNAANVSAEIREVSSSAQNFIVNGESVDSDSLLIDGYNYLKVSEFAELLDIDIAFDETAQTVILDKTKPFSGVRLIKAEESPAAEISTSESGDDIIAKLFEDKQSDVQVQGTGKVTRLLADDNDGGRHQRFILELGSGQTLLIAHNIDIAPRLDGLAIGDSVDFYGEYYYSEQGGGIHWTHNDPDSRHIDGWLKWSGQSFE